MKRTIATIAALMAALAVSVADAKHSECKCDASTMCVTDKQMVEQVKHVEMDTTNVRSEALVGGIVISE